MMLMSIKSASVTLPGSATYKGDRFQVFARDKSGGRSKSGRRQVKRVDRYKFKRELARGDF